VTGVAATLADVERIIAGLPEISETTRWGNRTWQVAGNGFAWERPLSKADIKRLGSDPVPAGVLLAVRVADLGEKEAVLTAGTAGVFTIAHFNNYPAVLIQLSVVGKKALRELIVDGWLACAPRALAEQYLNRR
jgi:hypothetical protein